MGGNSCKARASFHERLLSEQKSQRNVRRGPPNLQIRAPDRWPGSVSRRPRTGQRAEAVVVAGREDSVQKTHRYGPAAREDRNLKLALGMSLARGGGQAGSALGGNCPRDPTALGGRVPSLPTASPRDILLSSAGRAPSLSLALDGLPGV